MNTNINKVNTIAKGIASAITFLACATGLSAASFVDTNSHEESNFNNNSLSPFQVCTTAGESYVRGVSGRAKFVWLESSYRARGTRLFQGAEICAERALGRSQTHTGFKLYIPNSSSTNWKEGSIQFPSNKNTIIWQNFQLGSCNTWAAVMSIRNNDLYIEHRSYCGSVGRSKIYSNLPRNTWINVQIHTKASNNNTGWVHIHVNGVRRYLRTGINFGFGSWSASTQLATNSKQEIKFGMYAFDVAGHTRDEARTIYFDNCAVYNGGTNGWSLTDPS